MNTTIITNQMLTLTGSTGSPPYCLVPSVRSADVPFASPAPVSCQKVSKAARRGGWGLQKSGPGAPVFALLTPPTRCRPHSLDVCNTEARLALVHTCVKGVDG